MKGAGADSLKCVSVLSEQRHNYNELELSQRVIGAENGRIMAQIEKLSLLGHHSKALTAEKNLIQIITSNTLKCCFQFMKAYHHHNHTALRKSFQRLKKWTVANKYLRSIDDHSKANTSADIIDQLETHTASSRAKLVYKTPVKASKKKPFRPSGTVLVAVLNKTGRITNANTGNAGNTPTATRDASRNFLHKKYFSTSSPDSVENRHDALNSDAGSVCSGNTRASQYSSSVLLGSKPVAEVRTLYSHRMFHHLHQQQHTQQPTPGPGASNISTSTLLPAGSLLHHLGGTAAVSYTSQHCSRSRHSSPHTASNNNSAPSTVATVVASGIPLFAGLHNIGGSIAGSIGVSGGDGSVSGGDGSPQSILSAYRSAQTSAVYPQEQLPAERYTSRRSLAASRNIMSRSSNTINNSSAVAAVSDDFDLRIKNNAAPSQRRVGTRRGLNAATTTQHVGQSSPVPTPQPTQPQQISRSSLESSTSLNSLRRSNSEVSKSPQRASWSPHADAKSSSFPSPSVSANSAYSSPAVDAKSVLSSPSAAELAFARSRGSGTLDLSQESDAYAPEKPAVDIVQLLPREARSGSFVRNCVTGGSEEGLSLCGSQSSQEGSPFSTALSKLSGRYRRQLQSSVEADLDTRPDSSAAQFTTTLSTHAAAVFVAAAPTAAAVAVAGPVGARKASRLQAVLNNQWKNYTG